MSNDILTNAQKLEDEKEWIEAATLYEQLLDTSPTIDNYEKTAWCFSRAEKYDKAVEYSLKLHELEPLVAKWPYMIGYQYYSKNEWMTAIEWFEKALELYPDYFIVKYRLAYAYRQIAGNDEPSKKTEYRKALNHLEDCHKLWASYNDSQKQKMRSTYAKVNFQHGKMLMALPQYYSEAIELFQAVLRINPRNVDARYNIAKIYFASGDYHKANENLPTEKKPYVVDLSAKIEAQLGNYPESISVKDDSEQLEELNGSAVRPQLEQSEVCNYNYNKGYGFIKREPNNIFFHISNCKYSDIAVGDIVEFSIKSTDRGLNAVDVRKIN